MNVTLGFGADNKAEQELNKACPRQTFSLSELASTFFESNQDQDKLFVASASEVRLLVNPPEKFWKTNTQLVIVFMPPHMIASAIKDHCSSNQVASGSSFWVNRPASANFVKDLLPKIHPTALAGCRIRGIILTSIAASNGPAELLILEVPKGRSIQEDILQETNGCTIAGDSDSGILKILPLTTIEFTHEEDDGTSDSEKKMNSTEKLSASTKALQIPACPVCIHRIDPSRFGLPRPCAQHLCSNFCPSPCSMVEERCHKQSLLVSDVNLYGCIACAPDSNLTVDPLCRTNGRYLRDVRLVKLSIVTGTTVIGSTAKIASCFANSARCRKHYGHGKCECIIC